MEQEEINEYLESEAGLAMIAEQKQALIDKNAELLGKLSDIKARETAAAEATEADRLVAEKAKLDADNSIESYKTFHETEIAKKDDAINALKTNFASSELNRAVQAAAAKNSTTPKPLELLLRNRVKSEYDEAGQLQITPLDENGNALMHNGVKANMDQLVESLRVQKENAPFFSGTGSSGTGTETTDNKAPVGKPEMGEEGFNLTEAMGNDIS